MTSVKATKTERKTKHRQTDKRQTTENEDGRRNKKKTDKQKENKAAIRTKNRKREKANVRKVLLGEKYKKVGNIA